MLNTDSWRFVFDSMIKRYFFSRFFSYKYLFPHKYHQNIFTYYTFKYFLKILDIFISKL